MEGDAKPPKELSNSGNLNANWNLWKKEFQTYMKITKGDNKSEDEQVAWLKNFIGPVGLQAFEKISFDNSKDEENMTIVLEKLSQYFNITRNVKVQRYKFFSKSKQDNESIDLFVKDLLVSLLFFFVVKLNKLHIFGINCHVILILKIINFNSI